MRVVIVLSLLVALTSAALAQYPPGAYALVEPPDGAIAVIHPTRPAHIYLPGDIELYRFDVRLGEDDYNHWGDCTYVQPLQGAETLRLSLHQAVDGVNILESILPLGGPPDDAGWTTVDLADLHGGGHSDSPIELLATVPGFSDCYFVNIFSLEVRSPDINGDLVVDISDVIYFTRAYHGEYQSYADLRPDGILDLGDIVAFAWALNDR